MGEIKKLIIITIACDIFYLEQHPVIYIFLRRINLASTKFMILAISVFPYLLNLQNLWLLDYINSQIHKIAKFCLC